MTDLSSIGKRIRFCRVTCELSQKDLGDRLGYTQSRIAQWENNDRITLDILFKIAEITGYPISFLLGVSKDD